MNDNVIKFNKLVNSNQEPEETCQHCEAKFYHIETFLEHLLADNGKFTFDDLLEKVSIFYDIVYEESKTAAMEEIIDFASYQAYGED